MTDANAVSPLPDSALLIARLGPEAVKAPWWRRRGLLLALGGTLLLIAGALAWAQRQSASVAPQYQTEAVSRGTLSLSVTATGTLQPTRSVSLGSELSGTVAQVLVDVNDRVRRGQVLVRLDTSKLGDQLTRSEAALGQARAALLQAQATASESQASLARLEDVSRRSGGQVPAPTELDAARATAERAAAAVRSARAGVDDAAAQVRVDRTNLGKAAIRSPIDGIVLSRAVEPGNAVAASLQAVTLLTLAEDLQRLKLQVKVDEADVGQVQGGQSATFTVSSAPARAHPAKVTRVAFGSTLTDNVVTYTTDLSVDNRDLSLRPGMSATAVIATQERRDVLLVPNQALRFTPSAPADAARPSGGLVSQLMPRPPAGGGGTRRAGETRRGEGATRTRWVLENGAPRALEVQTGLSDGRRTEVRGEGLIEGLPVIVQQRATTRG